jgi:hypothetical protein
LLGVREIDEPVIGDRGTMRVPAQIMQSVFGSAEGLLGVDHPVFPKLGTEEGNFCRQISL